ncbi:MAG: hypothetical protein ACM3KR_05845 [Deltaproteobacteria bacterium]
MDVKRTVIYEDGKILVLRIGERFSEESTIFFGDLPLFLYGPNGKTKSFQEERYSRYKTDRIPFDQGKNLYLALFKSLQDMSSTIEKQQVPLNGWGIRDFAQSFRKAFFSKEISSSKRIELIGRSKGGLWAAAFLSLLDEESLKKWNFKLLAMGTPFGGTIMADPENLYPALKKNKKHSVKGRLGVILHERVFTGEQWDMDCIPDSYFLKWLHSRKDAWASRTLVVAGIANGCWLKKLLQFKIVELGCQYAVKNILGLVSESENDGVVTYDCVDVDGLFPSGRAIIVECSHEEFLSNRKLLREIFDEFRDMN